ncbi:MAG: shikimate kinase [Acidimicrobiales bacterium]
MAEHVMLIGMMGAGKSTIGRELAERLGWGYRDSDEQVQVSTGHTVPEIFAARGEAAFRAEEAKALAQAVTSDVPTVISVAGGAVLDPDNRRVIRGAGRVVWLRARVETLAARVGSGDGRPLLGDDPLGALRRLERDRRPVYAELADITVDVDDRQPGAVVDAVQAQLAELG